MLYQAHPDENMGGVAREAKQRLDDKFRAQRMSENKRYNKINTNKFFFFFLHRSDYLSEAAVEI